MTFQPVSMPEAIDLIIREIMNNYQPPNTIRNRDDANLWIAAFGQALTDETRDPAELMDAWREFRRSFTRGFWPIPGAVCQAVRDLRASRRAYEPVEKPHQDALPPPPKGKRWSELTDDEKAVHDERMRRAKAELMDTARAMSRPREALKPIHVPRPEFYENLKRQAEEAEQRQLAAEAEEHARLAAEEAERTGESIIARNGAGEG